MDIYVQFKFGLAMNEAFLLQGQCTSRVDRTKDIFLPERNSLRVISSFRLASVA